MIDLRPSFESYFFGDDTNTKQHGLMGALQDFPTERLDYLKQHIQQLPRSGRVFLFGNGGSLDNARLIAQLSRAESINAKTPGSIDDYIQYFSGAQQDNLFQLGLEQDHVHADDIVIGISGSGNSTNVLEALTYAKNAGAAIFCLGGRDGGKMTGICGEQHSIIVKHQCMETIEDLHIFAFLILLDAIKQQTDCTIACARLHKQLQLFLSDKNLNQITALAQLMIDSTYNNGRCFIIGTGIGSNHFRADMGRGATNILPIRGLACPELFTTNSALATANDDGADFILADGLVKYNCNENDCAFICNYKHETMYTYCTELLDAAGTPYVQCQEQGIDMSMLNCFDGEAIFSMIGHASGVVIKAYFHSLFHVRSIEADMNFEERQKKLGMYQCQQMEQILRNQEQLQDHEELTFCYGQSFATQQVDGNKLERCYY